MLILSIVLFKQTDYPLWVFFAFFLAPDVGMLGYLANKKIGAFTYNIFHHKGIAIALLCIGWYMEIPVLELSGIILFGHSSMDRIFGYGLKFNSGFKHTHLGGL